MNFRKIFAATLILAIISGDMAYAQKKTTSKSTKTSSPSAKTPTTTKTAEAKTAVDKLKKNPKSKKNETVVVFNEDFEKGEELFQLNRPKEAIAYFEKSLEKENVDPKVYVYLGICYYQIENYEKSLAVCVQGIAKEGTDKKILAYNAGNSCYAMGNYMRADASYAIALGEDENYAPAVLNRANAQLKLDHLADARSNYRKYLDLEPETPQRERIEIILRLLDEEIVRRDSEKPELVNADFSIENEKMELPAESEKVTFDDFPNEKADETKIQSEIVRSDSKAPALPEENEKLSKDKNEEKIKSERFADEQKDDSPVPKELVLSDGNPPAIPKEAATKNNDEERIKAERFVQDSKNDEPVPKERVLADGNPPEIPEEWLSLAEKTSPEKFSGENALSDQRGSIAKNASAQFSGEKLGIDEDLKRFEEENRLALEKEKREQEEKKALEAETARKKAEEERIAEENKRKIEEEARLAAEAKRKAAEEELRRLQAESARIAEENRRAREEARIAEENKRKTEEEIQRLQAEERQRAAEERLRQIEERARQAEEAARIAEENRKKAEEERIQKEKEERQRKALEAELARIEEEKRREEIRAKAEEEAKRLVEEAKKKAEEEARIAEENRKKDEEERQRKALEAEIARIEEEKRREEVRAKAEEEAKRLVEEAKKKAEEEARIAEEKRKKDKEERQRQIEEKKQAEIKKWPSPKARLAVRGGEKFTPDGDGRNDKVTFTPSFEYLEEPPESWSLTITDPKGNPFKTITGEGALPESIEWDGKSESGEVVVSRNTYKATFSVVPSEKDRLRTKMTKVETSSDIQTGLLLEVIVPGHEWKIVVQSIAFDPNGAGFGKVSKSQKESNAQTLDEVAQEIRELTKNDSDMNIIIEGYANNISGTEREEQEELLPLSQKRAETIVEELVKRGIDRKLLTPRGVGGKNPIASQDDHENWWKNRRVEFRITQ